MSEQVYAAIDRVFVVMGQQGEYSDRSEWTVRAFATESEAGEFLKKCEAFTDTMPPARPPGARGFRERDHSYDPGDRLGRHDEESFQDYKNSKANKLYQQWLEDTCAYWASGPDSYASDDATYWIATVPFGPNSTALQTDRI